jgi:NADH-quinone oxidoreductase subunit N
MNLGAFAVLVYLEARRGTRLVQETMRSNGIVSVSAQRGGDDSEDGNLQIGDLNGLGWREPFMAAALTLFLLSLAGIPPLAGFFGKLTIFSEAINQGLWGLVLIGALNTVISVYYYLRPVIAMYSGNELGAGVSDELRPSAVGDATIAAPLSRALPVGAIVAIVVCGAGVLAMFMLQTATLQWAQEAATAFVRR